jgi:hypothetical protein
MEMTEQNKKPDNKTDRKNSQTNWDDHEIQGDNTEKTEPELIDQEEKPEQSGEQHHKKEIPNDPSIIDLYDKDPNTATIHSSNAHSFFGDAPKNEGQDKAPNLNEDKSDSYPANVDKQNSNEADDSV